MHHFLRCNDVAQVHSSCPASAGNGVWLASCTTRRSWSPPPRLCPRLPRPRLRQRRSNNKTTATTTRGGTTTIGIARLRRARRVGGRNGRRTDQPRTLAPFLHNMVRMSRGRANSIIDSGGARVFDRVGKLHSFALLARYHANQTSARTCRSTHGAPSKSHVRNMGAGNDGTFEEGRSTATVWRLHRAEVGLGRA